MSDLRTRLQAATKQAMRDKDARRLATLRLINAAIKDQDIEARARGRDEGIGEAEILKLLGKMVKQRQESARTYEEGGRLDLAEAEREEIDVIESFLPRRLDEGEVEAAIDSVISEVGASSIRDMGRVMEVLKSRHAGQMDFSSVGPRVKARLCAPAAGG